MSSERQSLNKVFRAGLHIDAGAYASYGLNTAPQSPNSLECVAVKALKGNTSHFTSNTEHIVS